MSNDSLMQRMLNNGVDIHNFQAVFEFFHNLGTGEGGGLTEGDVTAIFRMLSNGFATTEQMTQMHQELSNNIDLLPILSSSEVQSMINQSTANIATQGQLIALRDALNERIDNFDTSGLVKREEIAQMVIQADLAAYALNIDLQQLPTRTDYNLKANLSDLDSKADKVTVQNALNEKLNRSEFHQHFRGLFSSVEALVVGVENPIAGDYANVDAGVDQPTEIYAYDVDDAIWRKQGSTGVSVSSSDNVPEGNSNLYFTSTRVLAVFSALSTTNLAEGSNLYFTPDRVKTVVRTMTTDDLPEGANKLYYTDARVMNVVNPILGNIESVLNSILGA